MACVNHPEVVSGLGSCVSCHRSFCSNCLVRIGDQMLCARCKNERVRDIQSGTGPGIELASLGRRFGALWIDSIIFGLGFFFGFLFIAGAASASGRAPSPESMASFQLLSMIVAGVVWLLYEGAMLQWRGQTLGKMATGVKVVMADGSELPAGQAWGRAAIRQVFFSYLAFVNYLPAAFTKQKTCIHDLILKTRVARVRR